VFIYEGNSFESKANRRGGGVHGRWKLEDAQSNVEGSQLTNEEASSR